MASRRRVDVKGLRTEMGLTQAQLAKRLSTTPLTVWRWETSRASPSPMALAHLKRAVKEHRASKPDSQPANASEHELHTGPARVPVGPLPSLS